MGILGEFLEPIVGPHLRKLRDSIVPFVLKLPRLAQANIVVVIFLTIATWEYRPIFFEWLSLDWCWVRVAFVGGEKPPIAGGIRKTLNDKIAKNTVRLAAQFDIAVNAWTAANIVVSLKDHLPDAGNATAYFKRQGEPGALQPGAPTWFAWGKYPGDEPNVEVSSWVILALSHLKRPASVEELRFILRTQHKTGWWSVLPSGEWDYNASSDATAAAIWALRETLAAGVQDSNGEIGAAISRGASWLLGQQIGNTARWKTYPTGLELLSASGFVLHVLHVTAPNSLSDDIDRIWLRSLPISPASLPLATKADSDIRTLFVGPDELKPIGTDDTRYYPLPCAIEATVDVYSNGDLFEEHMRFIGWRKS